MHQRRGSRSSSEGCSPLCGLEGLASSSYSTWSSGPSRWAWDPPSFTLRILTALVQGQEVAMSLQVHCWAFYSVPRSPCLFSSRVPLMDAAILWKSGWDRARHLPLSAWVAWVLVFPLEFGSCFCVWILSCQFWLDVYRMYGSLWMLWAFCQTNSSHPCTRKSSPLISVWFSLFDYILWFSVYRSCTFLVKCIPKHLTVFNVITDWIILYYHINKLNLFFCVFFIFNSATLVTLFTSSNILGGGFRAFYIQGSITLFHYMPFSTSFVWFFLLTSPASINAETSNQELYQTDKLLHSQSAQQFLLAMQILYPLSHISGPKCNLFSVVSWVP